MAINSLNSREVKIINKLYELAEQAKKEPNGDKFAKSISTLITSLKIQIQSSSPSKYPTNLTATLKALEIWTNAPSKYAKSAPLYGNESVIALKPDTYKCNRFVSDVFTESGAARGYSYEGSETFSYPTAGSNPLSHYPVSANTIYDRHSVSNMSSIDPRKAKIGDIIAFPSRDEEDPNISAHVGIYLGNGLYISAHQTSSRFGRQVSDGVEISPVPWGEIPRFKRFQGENQIYGTFSSAIGGGELLNTQNSQQYVNRPNSLVANATQLEKSQVDIALSRLAGQLETRTTANTSQTGKADLDKSLEMLEQMNNEKTIYTFQQSGSVKNIALAEEKKALLKELAALNSLQTNFPDVRERSAQHTL
jgi:NlpC/P60 family